MYHFYIQSLKGAANHLAANHPPQAVYISAQTRSIDAEEPPQKIRYFEKVWKYIASGNYNHAYKNDESNSVLKIPKTDAPITMDAAKRAIRVFSEINPRLTQKAKLCGQFWVSPFIESEQAITPKQQAEFIFQTYKESGRLILDGYCIDNILLSKQDGLAVCIDPGLAVRRGSIVSENYWYKHTKTALENRKMHINHMMEYINKYEYKKPILITIALDYIDRKQLDIDLKKVDCDQLLQLGEMLNKEYLLSGIDKFHDSLSMALVLKIFKDEETEQPNK